MYYFMYACDYQNDYFIFDRLLSSHYELFFFLFVFFFNWVQLNFNLRCV